MESIVLKHSEQNGIYTEIRSLIIIITVLVCTGHTFSVWSVGVRISVVEVAQ